ncbi:MAG: IS481 family transposase, partial [Bacteroidota bacterium]
MGLLLHGSARTTHATRRALQRSQKTVSALAVQHGLNRKTAAKWRKRQTVADAPMGPGNRVQP